MINIHYSQVILLNLIGGVIDKYINIHLYLYLYLLGMTLQCVIKHLLMYIVGFKMKCY